MSDRGLNVDGVSFDVDLFETGDPESGFHTKNDPDAPFHRTNVVQRKGAVRVKCDCTDIIHGQWGSEDRGVCATAMALHFRFDPLKRARRIASVNIEFKFFHMQGRHRENPEVVGISLNGSFIMVPTERTESLTRSAEGGLGGSILGANISSTLRWEKTVGYTTTDATSVVGSIDRLGATSGPNNAASWTLRENETTKSGVPAAMRVCILLKRKTDDDFKCTVKVVAKADIKTRMGQLIGLDGRREVDDPILFKTSLPPVTSKLMQYDIANLGSFDVTEAEDITFTTVRNGVIKEQSA